jgi:hypothetical protein
MISTTNGLVITPKHAESSAPSRVPGALLRAFATWHPHLESYLAGMSATAFSAPAIAIAVAFVTYMVRPDGGALFPLLCSVCGGLLGWGGLALVTQRFVTIESVNPAVYRELCSRFALLKAQMKVVEQELHERHGDGLDHVPDRVNISYALAEVHMYLARLQDTLGEKAGASVHAPHQDPSLREWVQGSGYIQLWDQLHRAEETLSLFAPLGTVIADAGFDEMRLNGSNIDNRATLVTQLQEALKVLNGLPHPGILAPEQFAAREKLRRVRRTINEFRDERRLGLVQARNRLIRTVTLTGLVGFSLIALPILGQASPDKLAAGVAFYLIGAIVGLFNRLYLDAGTEIATEDYGLAVARLLHTPLLSGLAALGGVLIIPMLSGMVNPSTDQSALLGVTLDHIFDLKHRPFGLVLAALFGLSPTVLINRLQQAAERYKTDLKSSASPNQRAAVAPTTGA